MHEDYSGESKLPDALFFHIDPPPPIFRGMWTPAAVCVMDNGGNMTF